MQHHAECFGELAVRDWCGRYGVHGPGECSGRERELNDTDEVVERNPAHILIAAADDATEAEAEGSQHFGQTATIFAQNETDAEIDNADIGVARGHRGGFPLLA